MRGNICNTQQVALILYRRRRFINHLLTYLLTYLQVHDANGLKQRPTKVRMAWAWDEVLSIDDTMDEWHKRLWAYVHVKGGHFEHLVCVIQEPILC